MSFETINRLVCEGHGCLATFHREDDDFDLGDSEGIVKVGIEAGVAGWIVSSKTNGDLCPACAKKEVGGE